MAKLVILSLLLLAGIALGSGLVANRNYYNGRTNSQDWSVSQGTSKQQLRRILLARFMKIVLQKTLLAAIESEELEEEEENEEAVEEMVNQLSAAIRNVGVGYDILRGSPDGDFNTGGIDPGILSTRVIFDFTYQKEKQIFYKGSPLEVPDQVNYHRQDACSSALQSGVYSGAKSYQNSIKFGASPGVTLYGFRFGLSGAVQKAESETNRKQRVYFDQKNLCNMGRVEYLSDAQRIHRLSRRFQDRVAQLPVEYDMSAYMKFIRDWGTHIIIRADLGTKQINRSSSTYTQVYQQLKKQNSAGIKFGGSFNGFGGSLDLDISFLKANDKNSSNLRKRLTSFRIGSEESMVPISLKLMDISEALRPGYWSDSMGLSASYKNLSVADKRENLARALKDYADYSDVSELKDPQIRIPQSWPNGVYALPAAANRRCPRHWGVGSRSQTSGGDIDISTNIHSELDVSIGRTITLGYCVKDNEDMDLGVGFDWPGGRYCIARVGGLCPQPEFTEGSITWNDKKTSITRRNRNSIWGKLPDGTYDKDTEIEFCCRNDGRPSEAIMLPITDPFVLYRYGGTCQSVNGTTVTEHFIQFDDNSLAFSKNECTGAHPDDDDCKSRHKLHYCFYRKK